jgi:hypothetical protein
MPKMLRHRKTGELLPMNADTARHDDMMAVDVPDLSKARMTRGNMYLDERFVFEGAEDLPADEAVVLADPAPAAETIVEANDDVDLSDIELPDDDD